MSPEETRMIARVRSLLAKLPEGREVEAAFESADKAVMAVVLDRVSTLPEAQRPTEHLLKAIANSCVGDLGFPWSEERRARATDLEKVAHAAIQDYWVLLGMAYG